MAETGINSLHLNFSTKIEDRKKTDENNNNYVETDIWDKNEKDNLDCVSRILNNCYDTNLYSAKGEAIWNKIAELNDLDSDYDKAMIMPEQKLILPESIDVGEIVTTDLEGEVTQTDVYDLDGNLLETSYANKDGGELTPVFDCWAQDYKIVSTEPFEATAVIDDCPAIITKNGNETNITFDLGGNGLKFKDGDTEIKSTQKVFTYNSQGSRIQSIHKNEQGEEIYCFKYEYDTDGKTKLKEVETPLKEGVALKGRNKSCKKFETEFSVTGKIISQTAITDEGREVYDTKTNQWIKVETK